MIGIETPAMGFYIGDRDSAQHGIQQGKVGM